MLSDSQAQHEIRVTLRYFSALFNGAIIGRIHNALVMPNNFSSINRTPHRFADSRPSVDHQEQASTSNPHRAPTGLLSPLGRRERPPRPGSAGAAIAASIDPSSESVWSAAFAAAEMSVLSPELKKRLLKKPASEQYRYAKNLTPAKRGDLERTLERAMRVQPDSQAANEALTMWLSIQHARLRIHDADEKASYAGRQVANVAIPLTTGVFALATPFFYRSVRRDYYNSPDRREYATAFDNFMRLIGDSSLRLELREKIARNLAYHACCEHTIAPREAATLEFAGFTKLEFFWEGPIPEGEAHLDHFIGAFELANERYRLSYDPNAQSAMSVEEDVDAQERPLGVQMNAWLREAGKSLLRRAAAFNDEENAASFARLLDRRLPPASQPNATTGNRHVLALEGAMVIRAIAEDPDLRAVVFGMANETLGNCGDKVAEGFAMIVNTVRNHLMAKAVERGVIGFSELDSWSRQQFRLDMLEKVVLEFIHNSLEEARENLAINETMIDESFPLKDQPFLEQVVRRLPDSTLSIEQRITLETEKQELQADIQRELEQEGLDEGYKESLRLLDGLLADRDWLVERIGRLAEEPVETKLHAKVALGESLDLPGAPPSGMEYEAVSVLKARDLKRIDQLVRTRISDPAQLDAFLLSNETWRVGMKKLYAKEFKDLEERYEKHPYWEIPVATTEEEQFKYLSRFESFKNAKETEENELLLKCAGLRSA